MVSLPPSAFVTARRRAAGLARAVRLSLTAGFALAVVALPGQAQAGTFFAFHTLGPNGGNGAFAPSFYGASDDGTHVFFLTDESLVAADTDTSTDLYESTGGGVFLRSDSTAAGVDPNTPVSCCTIATARKVSASGRAFFETAEQLAPATDTDATQTDVYASSSTANPIHVSRGAINGNGALPASYAGSSDDGNRVFFESAEQLVLTDTDGTLTDVYRWDIATSASTIMTPSTTTSFGSFAANSRDGTQVAFSTFQSLDASDNDAATPGSDLYKFNATTSTVSPISTDGADGAHLGDTATGQSGFVGASDSFDRFAFASTEKLATSDDADAANRNDIWFKQIGQPLQHATPNTASNLPAGFAFMSTDGKIFFSSVEAVCCGDADGQTDVFQFASGADTIVSTGQPGAPGAFPATLGGFTPDGSHVFFSTAEPMTPATDTDTAIDVYGRVNGSSTVHVSRGQQNGNGAFDASFAGVPADPTHAGVSADGSRVFFGSTEKLTSDDADSNTDIFERSAGATSRVSSGPTGGNGAFDANAVDTNAAGTRAVFSSSEHLFDTDTDAQTDLFGWELDNIPPDTTITSGPSGLTNSASPSFTFTSTEGGSTFECRLDAETFAACSSPESYSSLSDSSHTFEVRATDAAANTDATPASRSFTVDTSLPVGPNEFTIGKLKGTKLSLTVPGPGVVDVKDANASKKKLLLKHSSATASAAGKITVTLKLTKLAKKTLKRKHKVKVKAAITFTPTGGAAKTQTKGLKVKKH